MDGPGRGMFPPMNDTPRAPLVTTRHDGDVAIIEFDDGKANALSHDAIEAIIEAFGETEDAGAVVLVGRPERFSAGFDLKVMQAGPDSAQGLLRRGVDLFLRMYMYPRPVVAACTGHAIAAGAILLMCSDLRVGPKGDYQIGLPEVTIGMSLPVFATELARDRLSKRHYTRATALGTVYDPESACDVGFLDEVVELDQVTATAIERAGSLTTVGKAGLAATRVSARSGVADTIQQSLDGDLGRFSVDS